MLPSPPSNFVCITAVPRVLVTLAFRIVANHISTSARETV
jgi:hypothetical protein